MAEYELKAVPADNYNGSPIIPTGDPMKDGLGPAAWVNDRADRPDYTAHGTPKIVPLRAAKNYGAGFATVEYTACALLDQAMHALPLSALRPARLDVAAFEAQELARMNMPQGIVLRHRPFHFQHCFAGESYESAYYVYLWAEVLDADAFDAFKEEGGPFAPAVAARARRHIYGAGNTCVSRVRAGPRCFSISNTHPASPHPTAARILRISFAAFGAGTR